MSLEQQLSESDCGFQPTSSFILRTFAPFMSLVFDKWDQRRVTVLQEIVYLLSSWLVSRYCVGFWCPSSTCHFPHPLFHIAVLFTEIL